MREVKNPSAIFLNRGKEDAPGSLVMVLWEGTRPLLVEIQGLVDYSALNNPRRVTVGMELNRLSMLLAVMHRHAGIQMSDQDVFVNVVGGVKVNETGADLATLLALVSSFRNKALPMELVVFGELVYPVKLDLCQVAKSVCAKQQNMALNGQLYRLRMCPKSPLKG